MKGRRGFLSGVTKMGALGGAALLLPREALSDVQRAGLGGHADQVYIDESHEIGPDEVRKLLNRVRQLEQMVAQPTFFQGRDGLDGLPGVDGCPGVPGMTGPMGATGEQGQNAILDFHSAEFIEAVQNASYVPPVTQLHYQNGELSVTDPCGYTKTVCLEDNRVSDLEAQVASMRQTINQMFLATMPQRWAVVCSSRKEAHHCFHLLNIKPLSSRVGNLSIQRDNVEYQFVYTEDQIRGRQFTNCYVVPGSSLDFEFYNVVSSRCGRYPAEVPEGFEWPTSDPLLQEVFG